MDETRVAIDFEALRAYIQAIFERLDVPAEQAAVVADNLAEADLRGVASHGANLFAFVYDSAGRPVDMISSDSVTVAEGEEKTIEATSLATDDHCRGPRDPNGNSADFWLSFWSGNQLYSQLQNAKLP